MFILCLIRRLLRRHTPVRQDSLYKPDMPVPSPMHLRKEALRVLCVRPCFQHRYIMATSSHLLQLLLSIIGRTFLHKCNPETRRTIWKHTVMVDNPTPGVTILILRCRVPLPLLHGNENSPERTPLTMIQMKNGVRSMQEKKQRSTSRFSPLLHLKILAKTPF